MFKYSYQANNKMYYLFHNVDSSDTSVVHISFKFKNLMIESQPGVSEVNMALEPGQ